MNLLIHNATLITCVKKIIRQGAIAIDATEIVDIGRSKDIKGKYGRGYEKIDAEGGVVLPGFINTHQHAAMSLLRGYADDIPLREWLERWIWPVEKHMTAKDIYAGALLTAVESILSGVTTVNTMYHYKPEYNEAKAFADAGLRGIVGHVCFSWRKDEDKRVLKDLAKSWHNKKEGSIRVSVDPHAPYSVDPEYMKELKDLRRNLNEEYGTERAPVICHTHVAETSDEPQKTQRAFGVKLKEGMMKYLDAIGALDKHVIAAHCVSLKDSDTEVMKLREVKVSHNPISNLKLASGISPINKLLSKGITVSLGTDSPSSNNTADMFDLLKITALIHKGTNKDPTIMPAEKVLEMSTIEGAKAIAWENEIGSIEVGKKADLAILNFRKPHLHPLYNEVSHLVYAAKPSDVETVLINGKIIMENRRLTTLNVEGVMRMAERAKANLMNRLNVTIK